MASQASTAQLPGLSRFRDAFAGEIVQPTDPGYDVARRVWNAMIDRRPALVVRPTGAADIATAIRFARDAELSIAVRGGGHSLSGQSTCDGGLVIDLSSMRGVSVDPVTRRARANGGALLGELDAAAQEHGLVCPVGVVSHTGVGGLTLGGGMGRLQRKFGLTIDSLRRVELVTAEGRSVAASESEEPELFWAMRGAGPNFGVVTSFEFELHPLGPLMTRGVFVFPGAEATRAWAAFRDFAAAAPDEIHAAFSFSRAVPEQDHPAAVAGSPIVTVRTTHAGDEAAAERDLAPIRSFGTLASATLDRPRYLQIQGQLDEELAWGYRTYFKGGFTNDLPADAIEALVDHTADAAPGEGFGVWAQGGALSRVPDEATAFTGRAARFEMSAEASWTEAHEDERHVAWTRAAYAIAEPFATTGRYVNDVQESGMARSVYGDAKFERLRAVKRVWDPDNVFHLNQNIAP